MDEKVINPNAVQVLELTHITETALIGITNNLPIASDRGLFSKLAQVIMACCCSWNPCVLPYTCQG